MAVVSCLPLLWLCSPALLRLVVLGWRIKFISGEASIDYIPLLMLWMWSSVCDWCVRRGGGEEGFLCPTERKVNFFSVLQTSGVGPGHLNLQVRDS